MKLSGSLLRAAVGALFALGATAYANDGAAPAATDTKINPLLAKELTGVAPGKGATMLTVEYAPGASTPAHRHSGHTFVYVLEGSIVMQVAGGDAVTLSAGQTFYETPDDVHAVSKNASATAPAKFLVFLIQDKDAPVLVPLE